MSYQTKLSSNILDRSPLARLRLFSPLIKKFHQSLVRPRNRDFGSEIITLTDIKRLQVGERSEDKLLPISRL